MLIHLSGNNSEYLDENDRSDGSYDLINNTNAKDKNAETFEILSKFDQFAITISEQVASDGLHVPVPPLEHSAGQDIQSEAANLQSSPLVIIELYPHGSPGAIVS